MCVTERGREGGRKGERERENGRRKKQEKKNLGRLVTTFLCDLLIGNSFICDTGKGRGLDWMIPRRYGDY